MIIQYGSNILRNIEIPIILISCTSPQTKYDIYIAYRRMLELKLGVNYIVNTIDVDSQSFIILIYENDITDFINKAIWQNIPFRKLNKQYIMESNIDEIIHKILENRSIEETIDVVPGFITTKQIYLTTNITILNYDYSDVKILKSQLYYTTRNVITCIENCILHFFC